MAIADKPIIGTGLPTATIEQARIYVRTAPDRVLTGDEASQIAAAFWDIGPTVGIDPAVAFAMACHETNIFRYTGDVRVEQRNIGGIGTTGGGVPGISNPTWRKAVEVFFWHLLAWTGDTILGGGTPRYALVRAVIKAKGAATTWASLGGRWAVPGTGYGAAIERHHAAITAIGTDTEEAITMPKRIALASGHHNSSGGDAFEYQQTGELCEAVARACTALGMEVRVVQPDGPDADTEPGDGTIAGSLDAVGNTVVKWDNEGWRPDIFLECHTEGGGGTGVFAIYPDWGEDIDADVRDELGPEVATNVALATGLKIGGGGDGVMSEKQTGVGAGSPGQPPARLGIFRTTASLRNNCTRLIIEYGAHDKEPDLSVVKRPGFYDAAGKATAESFAAFLGVTPPPLGPPDAGAVTEGPARVVTPQTDWEGEGEIVSFEQIIVVRNGDMVSQRRQIDYTMQPWVALSKGE